jgi:hypothetical protein
LWSHGVTAFRTGEISEGAKVPRRRITVLTLTASTSVRINDHKRKNSHHRPCHRCSLLKRGFRNSYGARHRGYFPKTYLATEAISRLGVLASPRPRSVPSESRFWPTPSTAPAAMPHPAGRSIVSHVESLTTLTSRPYTIPILDRLLRYPSLPGASCLSLPELSLV